MEFIDYNQLRDYTSEWLTESESEQLWHWLQRSMITSEEILSITQQCYDDKICYANTTSKTAWETFLEVNKFK
jgi:hypothetical protein